MGSQQVLVPCRLFIPAFVSLRFPPASLRLCGGFWVVPASLLQPGKPVTGFDLAAASMRYSLFIKS
jgi:hypothetical protein